MLIVDVLLAIVVIELAVILRKKQAQFVFPPAAQPTETRQMSYQSRTDEPLDNLAIVHKTTGAILGYRHPSHPDILAIQNGEHPDLEVR